MPDPTYTVFTSGTESILLPATQPFAVAAAAAAGGGQVDKEGWSAAKQVLSDAASIWTAWATSQTGFVDAPPTAATAAAGDADGTAAVQQVGCVVQQQRQGVPH
jgi:hypothetical protein